MLINKQSGLKNSKNKLLDVIDVFCSYGYSVNTYVTQKSNDAYEYLMKNRVKYDLICVFGGDGTMNEVTNAMMHKKEKTNLAFFPSGTMNDFASNFELDNDIVEIAKKVSQKNEKYFDVGKFNDKYFNYVAAFGAMCDVPFTTDRNAKEILGNIAYILEGISKLSNIKKIDVEYEVNKKKYHKELLFGIIYSGNRVAGMQLETKNRSKIDDGYFNVLFVDYVPSWFEAPDLISPIIQGDRYIHRYRCQNIKLNFKENVIWTLDGENASSNKKEFDIEIYNKALSIYV